MYTFQPAVITLLLNEHYIFKKIFLVHQLHKDGIYFSQSPIANNIQNLVSLQRLFWSPHFPSVQRETTGPLTLAAHEVQSKGHFLEASHWMQTCFISTCQSLAPQQPELINLLLRTKFQNIYLDFQKILIM